jgi:hypothetical protein
MPPDLKAETRDHGAPLMARCWKAGRAAAHMPLEHNPTELAEAMRTVHLDALSLWQGEALAPLGG